MSAYHHKSGAKKLKERLERAEREKVGQQTLFNIGMTLSSKAKAESILTQDKLDNKDETLVKDISGEDTSALTAVNFESIPGSQVKSLQNISITRTIITSISPNATENNFTTSNNDNNVQATSLRSEQVEINTKYEGIDVGTISEMPPVTEIEIAVRHGPHKLPESLPKDIENRSFPNSVFQQKFKNSESALRDWLVWSQTKQALYCFPCRLFSKQPMSVRSRLATPDGYPSSLRWLKLYDKIPEHQDSNSHKHCYIQWRDLERRLHCNRTVTIQLQQNILAQTKIWKEILKRILDVTLFLGERGLAFRGTSHKIGESDNGNFLGLLELLSRYDPILREHLDKVAKSQKSGKRLQVHYLSPQSQNEFISACALRVKDTILSERQKAKYFSVMVDATPDSAHVKQTTFILRYLAQNEESLAFEIHERFLEFVDCNQKTGAEIAALILTILGKNSINISDCRGQGYDNGSNMSGKNIGAQACILKENPLAVFSPCGCHSLNLTGSHAAECVKEAVTFFGIVQKLYNLFSSSPQRWEILQTEIGCSLHNLCHTRWTDRVNSVRPFAAHLPGLKKALNALSNLNLTPETRSEVKGISEYITSFQCIVMSAIWMKVLVAIDQRNQIIQARSSTIDVEIDNIDSLLADLKILRLRWNDILTEAKLVAEAMDIPPTFPSTRVKKRKRFHDETPNTQLAKSLNLEDDQLERENNFQTNVFFVLMDSVISNLSTRYDRARAIYERFSFTWTYLEITDNVLTEQVRAFVNEYSMDVSKELLEEIRHLKVIHSANLGDSKFSPLELLNKLHTLRISNLFPNCCIALRIFCTLPVTVAEAERSFSHLARIKNVIRSTMGQERLTDLSILAIECELARRVNFKDIIETFASRKARKACLII